jgi:hypothetical protein
MISARNIKAPHFCFAFFVSRYLFKERKTALEASRIPFGDKDNEKLLDNDKTFDVLFIPFS